MKKLIFLLILVSSIFTSGFEDISSLRSRGEDGIILPGDRDAQYELGRRYYYGVDVPVDYVTALWWLKKAAEQDEPCADFLLAEMYEKGKGREIDYKLATHYYRLAADNGYGKEAVEKYKVTSYMQSLVEKAKVDTFILKWFVSGDSDAQYKLGYEYIAGKKVPKDVDRGIKWLTKSAKQNNSKAMFLLGKVYLDNKNKSTNLKKGMRWLKKAAHQGNGNAQFRLGQMFYSGKDIPQDYSEAFDYLTLSANQGNEKAQYLLADMYALGNGVKKDMPKALNWLKKSANQGFDKAQYRLGFIYYSGNGISRDSKKARKFITLAANQNNIDAQYLLGQIYYKGQGVEQNEQKALYWFGLAAKGGLTKAKTDYENIKNKINEKWYQKLYFAIFAILCLGVIVSYFWYVDVSDVNC